MMLEQDGIEKIRSVLEEREGISAAYLYGSRARDEGHEGSDMDIGLLLKENFEPSARYPARIAIEIEDRAGLEDVDVRILNGKSPRFLHNVLKDSKLIYCGDGEHRVDFESSSLVRYLDMKPFFEERKKMMKKRASE